MKLCSFETGGTGSPNLTLAAPVQASIIINANNLTISNQIRACLNGYVTCALPPGLPQKLQNQIPGLFKFFFLRT